MTNDKELMRLRDFILRTNKEMGEAARGCGSVAEENRICDRFGEIIGEAQSQMIDMEADTLDGVARKIEIRRFYNCEDWTVMTDSIEADILRLAGKSALVPA